jgi:hypothetical protein
VEKVRRWKVGVAYFSDFLDAAISAAISADFAETST